jgi:hypothetical protein
VVQGGQEIGSSLQGRLLEKLCQKKKTQAVAVMTGVTSAHLISTGTSEAGCSKGATSLGDAIVGGFSSTLAGGTISALGLGLNKSPTRADRRRLTLRAFASVFGGASVTTDATAASLEKKLTKMKTDRKIIRLTCP